MLEYESSHAEGTVCTSVYSVNMVSIENFVTVRYTERCRRRKMLPTH